MKQGRIMLSLLNSLEIPYFIIDRTTGDLDTLVSEAVGAMSQRMAPVAVLVKPDTFAPYAPVSDDTNEYPLSREDAMKIVIGDLSPDDLVVSTTGKTSRELYEHRRGTGATECRDFLTVGSMGHASSIAMALSSALPDRRIICLDGDGSVIMHMGSMAVIGQMARANLVHVVLNNGAHESVGGQPTVGFSVDFIGIARSCGYDIVESTQDAEGLKRAMENVRRAEGPSFIEVRVNRDVRDNLGRPKEGPIDNRKAFMRACGSDTRR